MGMKRKKFCKNRSKLENTLDNCYSSSVKVNNNELIKCYTEEFCCAPKRSKKNQKNQ